MTLIRHCDILMGQRPCPCDPSGFGEWEKRQQGLKLAIDSINKETDETSTAKKGHRDRSFDPNSPL